MLHCQFSHPINSSKTCTLRSRLAQLALINFQIEGAPTTGSYHSRRHGSSKNDDCNYSPIEGASCDRELSQQKTMAQGVVLLKALPLHVIAGVSRPRVACSGNAATAGGILLSTVVMRSEQGRRINATLQLSTTCKICKQESR